MKTDSEPFMPRKSLHQPSPKVDLASRLNSLAKQSSSDIAAYHCSTLLRVRAKQAQGICYSTTMSSALPADTTSGESDLQHEAPWKLSEDAAVS